MLQKKRKQKDDDTNEPEAKIENLDDTTNGKKSLKTKNVCLQIFYLLYF